jgi:preprotein translocase subunit SecA
MRHLCALLLLLLQPSLQFFAPPPTFAPGRACPSRLRAVAAPTVSPEVIEALEPTLDALSDASLRARTASLRAQLPPGSPPPPALIAEAFAVAREASWRVLSLRHYPVQLLAGLALQSLSLAEMATGEGKTLTTLLPGYLNALRGGTVVVAPNEYLARRDSELLGQVYRFLGVSVGLVTADMSDGEKRDNYGQDVVYVTNSELGFDYLRSNLALSPEAVSFPPSLFERFVIVDEADSVLIDEARTPLVISKATPTASTKYATAAKLAAGLSSPSHYKVDAKAKNVILTEKGYGDSEAALGVPSLFETGADGAWAPFVVNAVKAKELFAPSVDYQVSPSAIELIDAFSGRVLPGRKYADGLHQALEAKHGIEVSARSSVIAKISFQVSPGEARAEQHSRAGVR